jgi:cell division protein FtsA
MASALPVDEIVEVASFGHGGRQAISRRQLTEILEARAEEIMTLILREIKRSGYDGLLAAGLVLCGGAAELAGFAELAQQVLQLPVRIGAPRDLQGMTDTLEGPAYATAVGLLLWGVRQAPPAPQPRSRTISPNQWWERVRQLVRAFLPG